LVPKKAKEFKKETAQDVNLPEDLVSKLIDHYWEKVRKHVVNLEYNNINILNLGTFRIKHWKIDETIETYTRVITHIEERFATYAIKKELQERIEKLKALKGLAEEQKNKFKEIKEKRYDQENKKNMEQQDPDMGRLQEPGIQD
jgi:nucleoid DNA-binding protein